MAEKSRDQMFEGGERTEAMGLDFFPSLLLLCKGKGLLSMVVFNYHLDSKWVITSNQQQCLKMSQHRKEQII